jgi:glycerol-3-phosphate acyltransferase PlsX
MKAKISIDAMGLDNGSKVVVAGIKKYLKEHDDIEIHVFGKIEELDELKDLCVIHDAREVVEMEAGTLEVMRKKESSMVKAINSVKEGVTNGVISFGSTGGFLSASTITLKLIPNVLRAALTTFFPTQDGKGVLILDIGASNENTPEQLRDFFYMGQTFIRSLKNKEPNIYLISNGAEEKKGSPLTKKAHELLKNEPNFKGNIEAREALSGDADVVIFPGFEGNIFLKGVEGIAKIMMQMLKKAFTKNLSSKLGYLFAKNGIQEIGESFNYKKYGGAILIGIQGICVKGHGNSDAEAVYNAIRVTHDYVNSDIVKKLSEEFHVAK